ncbi:MAG: ribonuclease III [Chlorobi bacterium]|nr:ribonuclease III [Chlorobiota bacterium]
MLLKKQLGITPRDLSVYELAFIPKSRTMIKEGNPMNNERLEYLGDAVFTNLVSELLYRVFPNKNEGQLSKIRAKIISRNYQERIARSMGLDKIYGETTSLQDDQTYLYANTLEALIGAMFLDKGYRKTRRYFLDHLLEKHIDIDHILNQETDFKSLFLNWCQKNKQDFIFQTTQIETETKGGIIFSTLLLVNQKPLGKGKGKTKKAAEQEAARQAWKKLIYSNPA